MGTFLVWRHCNDQSSDQRVQKDVLSNPSRSTFKRRSFGYLLSFFERSTAEICVNPIEMSRACKKGHYTTAIMGSAPGEGVLRKGTHEAAIRISSDAIGISPIKLPFYILSLHNAAKVMRGADEDGFDLLCISSI